MNSVDKLGLQGLTPDITDPFVPKFPNSPPSIFSDDLFGPDISPTIVDPDPPSMMDQLPVKSDPLGGYSYWGVYKCTFNNNWSRVRNGSRYKLTCHYDCDELINCHEGNCPDPLNATIRLQEEVDAPKGSCPVCAGETTIQSWKGKGRPGPGYKTDGEYAQPYGSIIN